MNHPTAAAFSLCILQIINQMQSQSLPGDAAGDNHSSEQSVATFWIADDSKLLLNDTYCLKSISVKAYLSNATFEEEVDDAQVMFLDITWESDQGMESLTVESNSPNDSYCDSDGRFSYHRKPVKEAIHTFPDIVNFGYRYIPIKLDCSYIIIPEMTYHCSPVHLLYTTPVCLSQRICSCRNTNLPGPIVNVENEKDGVTVHWKIPQDETVNISDIKKIYVTLRPSREVSPSDLEGEHSWQLPPEESGNVDATRGTFFFPIESTRSRAYVVTGFYQNSFQCQGNATQLYFTFPGENAGSNAALTYFLVSASILTTFIAVLLYSIHRKAFFFAKFSPEVGERQQRERKAPINNENHLGGLISINNPIYSCHLPFEDDDPLVIDYEQLMFKRKLDEGNFGVVHLASTPGGIRGLGEFAVKQLKNTASKEDVEDFLQEIEIFKKAGTHAHIVRLIGICVSPFPLSIVMEYVPRNLLRYLKNLRENFLLRNAQSSLPEMPYINEEEVARPLKEEQDRCECPLDGQELESFALQIARGMEHLEKNDIVHRDLAARNVLIDNRKTLKISDFGMSRMGTYVNKTDRKFPLRWMPPEAITDRIFSSKSDIWSYGVVLWEIGTLGGFPYPDLQNQEVLALLRKGDRLDRPEIITNQLYQLMNHCWAPAPECRPTFAQVVHKIEKMRHNAYVDMLSLRDSYVFPPTGEGYSER